MFSTVYRITGSFSETPTNLTPTYSASINFWRASARRRYDRLLLGTATKAEVGEGDLVGTATPPSWTQVEVGLHHGYHIPAFSASHHETSSRNAYLSRSVKLEDTIVSATGSEYYSKSSRFVKLMYKVSASDENVEAGIIHCPSGNLPYPPNHEFTTANRAVKFTPISGSYLLGSMFDPAVVEFDVAEYGKIRDAKVWVEFIHDSRTGGAAVPGDVHSWGGLGDSNANPRQGLQGIQIALRSPNTNFKYAHPLWNNQSLADKVKWPLGAALANTDTRYVPDLLKNSYLLWAGHAVEDDLGYTLGKLTASRPDDHYTLVHESGSGLNTGSMTSALPHFMDCDASTEVPVVVYVSGTAYQASTKPRLILRRYNSADFESTELTFDSDSIDEITSTDHLDLVNSPVVRTDRLGNIHLAWVKSNPMISAATPGSASVFYYMRPGDGSPAFVETLTANAFKYTKVDLALSGTTAHLCFISASMAIVAKKTGSIYSAGFQIEQAFPIPDTYPPTLSFCMTDDGTRYIAKTHFVDYTDALTNGRMTTKIYKSSSLQTWHQIERPAIPYFSVADQWLTNKSEIIAMENDIALVEMFLNRSSGYANLPYFIYASISSSDGWTHHKLDESVRSGDPTVVPYQFCLKGSKGKLATLEWNSGIATVVPDREALKIITLDRGSGLPASVRSIVSSSVAYIAKTACLTVSPAGIVHIFCQENSQNNLIRYYATSGSMSEGAYGIEISRGKGASSSFYHSFNTDIDMRTIFDDSSPYMNPRHILPGRPQTAKLADEKWYSSPSSSSFLDKWIHPQYADPIFDTDHKMTGSNIPWYFDERIPPGAIFDLVSNYVGGNLTDRKRNASVYGDTTNVTPSIWKLKESGDFLTAGTNFGPPTIKPVYPLLDDVFVRKTYDYPTSNFPSSISGSRSYELIGYRPGLMGTEVHGKWKLMFGMNGNRTGSDNSFSGSLRDGIWFRQARLEFTIDQGEDISPGSDISSRKRFMRTGNVNARGGSFITYFTLSGSAAWDVGVNEINVVQRLDPGRSYGITMDENDRGAAVYVKITGSFRDILSGSGKLESIEASFLDNEFGTPYIPISSGSAETPTITAYTAAEIEQMRNNINSVLNPTKIIPSDNSAHAMIKRADVVKTTAEQIDKKISEE